MDILYAPWRGRYITDTVRSREKQKPSNECVFCAHFKEDNDSTNFILKRCKSMIVMLNRYPYNSGHLMILPVKHIGQLYELPTHDQQEMMTLATHSSKILQTVLECDGINIGINLGKAAGAGLPGHLHMHLLPRWNGDTNWLPLLADTKQISVDLEYTYKELKPSFDELVL